MTRHILLTGLPGVGKTTIIKKVLDKLNTPIPGFYTEEIREQSRRVGFRVISTSNPSRTELLSHMKMFHDSKYKVGKYNVNQKGFEEFIKNEFSNLDSKLFIIDEIGKMECFFKSFIDLTRKLLNNEQCVVIGTIALRSNIKFIEEVKKRNDVQIWTVTEENRDAMVDRLYQFLN